jgi:uncharacterized membrane protein YccC
MLNRRRWILVITSVLFGTFLAALLIQSRMGTLNAHAWQQLAVNFAFAVAIVVALGIFLTRQRKNEERERDNKS